MKAPKSEILEEANKAIKEEWTKHPNRKTNCFITAENKNTKKN